MAATVIKQGREILDPRGDLTLVVCGNGVEKEFLVCSRALSRASPVFDTMLHGPFKEAQQPKDGNPWTVRLEEDNPFIANVVLSLVHMKIQDIGGLSSNVDFYYKVLQFTNKYDMTKAIYHWARSWPTPSSLFLKTQWPHRLLGIAWELGDRSELYKVARRMIVECEWRRHHCGLWYVNSPRCPQPTWVPLSYPVSMSIEPNGLLDRMISIRLKILSGIFDQMVTRIKHLQVSAMDETYDPTYCHHYRDRRACTSAQMGAIFARLSVWEHLYIAAHEQLQGTNQELKLGNVHPVYGKSINHLLSVITSFNLDRTALNRTHTQCPDKLIMFFDGLKKQLVDDNQEDPLSDELKALLLKQQQKLGLPVTAKKTF